MFIFWLHLFLFKMDHPCLKIGKRYAAETRNKNIYIGTYAEYVKQYGYITYYVLDDVTKYHSILM